MALRGQMQQYNIKVMGVGGVGRMALIVRFVVDHFYEGYDPTAYGELLLMIDEEKPRVYAR